MMRSMIPSSTACTLTSTCFSTGASALLGGASRRFCSASSSSSAVASSKITNVAASLARYNRNSASGAAGLSPSFLNLATAGAPRPSCIRRFCSSSAVPSTSTSDICRSLYKDREDAKEYLQRLDEALNAAVRNNGGEFYAAEGPYLPAAQRKNSLVEQLEQKLKRLSEPQQCNTADKKTTGAASETSNSDKTTNTCSACCPTTWPGFFALSFFWMITSPFGVIALCCVVGGFCALAEAVFPSNNARDTPFADPYEGLSADEREEKKDEEAAAFSDAYVEMKIREYKERQRRRMWRRIRRFFAELPRRFFVGLVILACMFQAVAVGYGLWTANAAAITAAFAWVQLAANPRNYYPVVATL